MKKRGNKKYMYLKGTPRKYREEYAAEYTPTLRTKSTTSFLTKEMVGKIVGYIGVFSSLFSLFLFPIFLGISGVIMGIIAYRANQKVLGLTAIGFGAFSTLFIILFNIF